MKILKYSKITKEKNNMGLLEKFNNLIKRLNKTIQRASHERIPFSEKEIEDLFKQEFYKLAKIESVELRIKESYKGKLKYYFEGISIHIRTENYNIVNIVLINRRLSSYYIHNFIDEIISDILPKVDYESLKEINTGTKEIKQINYRDINAIKFTL